MLTAFIKQKLTFKYFELQKRSSGPACSKACPVLDRTPMSRFCQAAFGTSAAYAFCDSQHWYGWWGAFNSSLANFILDLYGNPLSKLRDWGQIQKVMSSRPDHGVCFRKEKSNKCHWKFSIFVRSMTLMKFLQVSVSIRGLFHVTLRLALTHTGRSVIRQEANRSRCYTQ